MVACTRIRCSMKALLYLMSRTHYERSHHQISYGEVLKVYGRCSTDIEMWRDPDSCFSSKWASREVSIGLRYISRPRYVLADLGEFDYPKRIEKNSEKEYRKSGEMFYNMEPTALSRGLIIMPPTRFMPARRPKFAQTRRVMQSISSIKKVGRKSLW